LLAPAPRRRQVQRFGRREPGESAGRGPRNRPAAVTIGAAVMPEEALPASDGDPIGQQARHRGPAREANRADGRSGQQKGTQFVGVP
jgi:hypothetical protein